MRVVIVGGGMVGLALARLLRGKGVDPVVLERQSPGSHMPRPFMLGFQGFPALEDAGVYDGLRAAGWDIAPREDGTPVAICVDFIKLIALLGDGVPVAHEEQVVELMRDGDRIVGVVTEGPGGLAEVPADLVAACDGAQSPTREMAGLPATVTELGNGALGFMGPAIIDRSFSMAYLSDGNIIGLLGWPGGSAGWWTIDKLDSETALAPGLDAFKRSFSTLLPEATEAVGALTSIDQVRYSEPRVLTAERWWAPGAVILGDAAHFFGPETGVAAGLGLGDAHALAEAIGQNPDDPDAACASYQLWREPVVRPYESNDPARQPRPEINNEDRPEPERWPPTA